jgi:hypothetical protein
MTPPPDPTAATKTASMHSRGARSMRSRGARDARRTLPLIMTIALLTVPAGCRSPGPPSTSASYEALQRLTIVDRATENSSYRRSAFGRSWADLDGDGCNTRDEVLLATVDTSRPYQTRRRDRCRADMVAGTWTDLYTGTVTTWTNLKDPAQAQALPIDHIVSLAGSWRYAARQWPQQRRVQFANDELNLTPTTADVNRQRADQDPVTWTPPPAGRCGYATRYISVKARYDLPVDVQEKAALERLLRTCPSG